MKLSFKLSTAKVSVGLLALSQSLLSACAVLALAVVAIPATAVAQAGFGPLDPAPPAGLTPDQIIQKFAARETVFDEAR